MIKNIFLTLSLFCIGSAAQAASAVMQPMMHVPGMEAIFKLPRLPYDLTVKLSRNNKFLFSESAWSQKIRFKGFFRMKTVLKLAITPINDDLQTFEIQVPAGIKVSLRVDNSAKQTVLDRHAPINEFTIPAGTTTPVATNGQTLYVPILQDDVPPTTFAALARAAAAPDHDIQIIEAGAEEINSARSSFDTRVSIERISEC